MADSAHLERMGRELNCPICLSLLSSAVSLTCNHVFCNSCIVTSMKSASNCPVCKVPYGRREVRPAPHMDNLVSIYKSMEVASGLNIYATQNTPSTKLSGKEKQQEGGDMVGSEEVNIKICGDTPNPQNKRTCKTKRSTGSSKALNTCSKPAKLSFPRKKRVQVPQNSPLETPVMPKKRESGIVEQTNDGFKKDSVVMKDKIVLNENGETQFTPFFWLREEEDKENSTQQTDGDIVMDTPPAAPCFSDMKDSDDDVPCNLTPKTGPCNISHNADIFDSEMFECTQRPCSPKHYSNPVKSQIKETVENNMVLEKEYKSPSQKPTRNGKLSANKRGSKKNANKEFGTIRSQKRERKTSEITQVKRQKRYMGTEQQKIAEDKVLEKTCENKGTPMNLEANVSTSTEKTLSIIVDLSSSLDEKKRGSQSKKSGKRSKKISGEKQGNDGVQTSTQELITTMNTVIESKSNEVLVSQSKNESLHVDGDNAVCNMHNNIKESAIKNVNACGMKPKSSKKVKFSKDENCMNKLVDDFQSTHKKVAMGSPIEVAKNSSDVRVANNSSETEKSPFVSDGILHKCQRVCNKIQCAFCQSTEDSEASGAMVHYLKGKPITENYDGYNVIHAHRNCTEWAPNVYFEVEDAINLEAEIARSKRIKCCCCGTKGAALGCYEKTCRKSFHIPCAKLTPECRWDNEYFVMLCPLHASLKLPNEKPGSQLKVAKKSSLKIQSHSDQSQVVPKHTSSTCMLGNSGGSFGKLVLCCSALTNAEKELVTEFKRLSGVSLSKNWDSSVTHVIASTDENAACRRTLKFLMGILEGKWILSIEWVKACLKVKEHVDEQPYEITVDIHGIRDGPRLGRLRLLNKQPKLFNSYEFYFIGDYVPSYKGYLYDLVTAAGGTVLHRKPINTPNKSLPSTFVIYSVELPDKCNSTKAKLIINHRKSDAEALASSSGATVATNSWILNSIAACKLQNLE